MPYPAPGGIDALTPVFCSIACDSSHLLDL
jgi:hypothetical protein